MTNQMILSASMHWFLASICGRLIANCPVCYYSKMSRYLETSAMESSYLFVRISLIGHWYISHGCKSASSLQTHNHFLGSQVHIRWRVPHDITAQTLRFNLLGTLPSQNSVQETATSLLCCMDNDSLYSLLHVVVSQKYLCWAHFYPCFYLEARGLHYIAWAWIYLLHNWVSLQYILSFLRFDIS